jgi:hypothetical protein
MLCFVRIDFPRLHWNPGRDGHEMETSAFQEAGLVEIIVAASVEVRREVTFRDSA